MGGGIWSLALVRLSYPCLDPAEQNAEDPLTLHGGGGSWPARWLLRTENAFGPLFCNVSSHWRLCEATSVRHSVEFKFNV